jgi:hypothetical protein
MEPSSTSGIAAIKIALAFGVPAALAAIIGLLLMPPRTAREFVVRTVSTVACSLLFGPLLAISMVSWMPSLIGSAHWMATRTGGADQPLLELFYLLGPCMLIAGLPAWWILGAYMHWMASMREKGLPAWVREMRSKIMGA